MNFDTLAKSVCAFLNCEGGTLDFDKDNPDLNAETLKEQLVQAISPHALLSVNLVSAKGKSVFLIDVPEGKDRPYIFDGSVYLKVNKEVRLASSEELRQMLQVQSAQPERWERRPAVAMDDRDLDVNEIAKAKQGLSKFLDDIKFLRSLSLYNSKGFTQAADVLFSINPSLRHPQTRVRVTHFASDKAGDKFLDDRVLQGPLVRVFEESFEFIVKHVRLQSKFDPTELKRLDQPEYPLPALREGLINAFAHRDYSGFSGGLSVGVYPDRIEIWNSGRFPKELRPSDLKKSHPSLPTNPDMAQVFQMRGLMERIGRGGQLILSLCKASGLPEPKWSEKPSGVTLIFWARVESSPKPLNMNSRQEALLRELPMGASIRPIEYQTKHATDVSERQARRDLVELEQNGYLRRVGRGPATTFVRTSQVWEIPKRT